MSTCNRELYNCPVEATIDLIGGKWKALILFHLFGKTLRFSEIHRLVPKATQKMLTQQLRDLENDGLINRKIYQQIPPKVEYSLTSMGESLKPVLDSMCRWGDNYLNKNINQKCKPD